MLSAVTTTAVNADDGPSSPPAVVDVAAGLVATCAVLESSDVYCWGANFQGLLGIDEGESPGSIVPAPTRIPLPDNVTATQATVGHLHACLLDDDGDVWCWGNPAVGQLGNGEVGDPQSVPTPQAITTVAEETFSAVAAGDSHTCALSISSPGPVDEQLYCWGDNSFEQLGSGPDSSSPSNPLPTPVFLPAEDGPESAPVVAFDTGGRHTCALVDDGRVLCWGHNGSGQVGLDPLEGSVATPSPVTLPDGATVVDIALGDRHSCVLVDGVAEQVFCWGDGGAGQTGPDGDGGGIDVDPVPVPMPDGFVPASIDAGALHTCVLDADGDAVCWGLANSGRLGNGVEESGSFPPVSVDLPEGRTATAIAAGSDHTCAVLDDSVVACWGRNEWGVLGNGSTTGQQLSPVAVRQTPLAPGAPGATAGPGRVFLGWDAPSGTGFTPITGYRIESRIDGQVSWITQESDTASTSTAHMVTGLTNGVTYQFRVTALNDSGGGSASSASNPVTPAATPDTPADLTAAGGDTTISVSWTAPDDGGAPIEEYRLGITTADAASCETTDPGLTTTATSFVIQSVANNVAHWVCIDAVNAEGASAPATTGPVTPTEPEPDPDPDPEPDPEPDPVEPDPTPPGPTEFVPLEPARLLDTRVPGSGTTDGLFAATGPLPGGQEIALQVTGRGGVSDDADAVVLNVTVNEPANFGFVTAYPCGTERPNASNLNYTPGQTIPNNVIVKVGDGGTVCLYSDQTTNLIADVNGYLPDGPNFVALAPARLLDTRAPGGSTVDGEFASTLKLPGGDEIELQVAGRGGVPDDADAVVLNVTVNDPEGFGFATIYPCGTGRPNASNLNYTPGDTIPNNVVVTLGDGGTVCLFSDQTTNLIADVNGYVPAGSTYRSLVPARLLDTRPTGETIDGEAAGGGALPGGEEVVLRVAGRGGVPDDATAAVLNVTVNDPEDFGFVTVYPCETERPNASNLNYEPELTIPNNVIVKLGANGTVCLYSDQTTHLIADANGAF